MGDEMGGFFHVRIKEGVFREFRSQYFLFGVNGFQHDEKDATDKQPLGYTKTDAKQSVEKVGNRQLDHFFHQHADEMNPDEDGKKGDDKSDVMGGEHPIQFFFYKIRELVGDEDAQNKRKQRKHLLDETVFETFENGPKKGNEKYVV